MLKRTLLCVVPLVAVAACGTSGGTLAADTPVTVGDAGDAGVTGTPVVTQSMVAVGNDNCPNGGTEVQAGLDTNGDGMLDVITSTVFICNGLNGMDGLPGAQGAMGLPGLNGEVGPVGPQGPQGFEGPVGSMGVPGSNGLTSLVVQSTLPVGNTTCANGGVEVQSGLDLNADNILQSSEVSQTSFICNGLNGWNGSQGIQGVQGVPGSIGMSGTSATIQSLPLPVGNENCPTGGVALTPCFSAPNQEAPVCGATTYVCNGNVGATGSPGAVGSTGEAGANGLTSLILQVSTAPDCATGGTTILSGVDLNSNGVLDANEVVSATEICNGQTGATGSPGTNGLNAIVVTSSDNGTFCGTNGGTVFTPCLQDGDGGAIDCGQSSFVCNGSTGAAGSNGSNGTNAVLQSDAATSDQCHYGGTIYTPCTTDSNNVVLGCGSPSVICNGSPGEAGAVGATGEAGSNGSSATVTTAPDTTDCPVNGGTQFTITNTDANGNVTTTVAFVCNGLNGDAGAPGVAGEAGSNGSNGDSASVTTAAATSAQCPNGGTQFTVTLTDGDGGVIGTPQVSVVCNGLNGEAGAPGANADGGAPVCATVSFIACDKLQTGQTTFCASGNGRQMEYGCVIGDGGFAGKVITEVEYQCNTACP